MLPLIEQHGIIDESILSTKFSEFKNLSQSRQITQEELLFISRLDHWDRYRMDVLIEHVGSELPRFDDITVIGRFQPFHIGHIFVNVLAASLAKRVTLGIGSANAANDPDNPFSPQVREKLILESLAQDPETLRRVHNVVYLDDHYENSIWLSETVKKVGSVDAVMGRNPWVNDLLAEVGIIPIEPPEYDRFSNEGSKIRRFLRNKGFILEGLV